VRREVVSVGCMEFGAGKGCLEFLGTLVVKAIGEAFVGRNCLDI